MRYSFEQYFGDEENGIRPYANGREELKDRFRLFDIILENFMDVIMEHEQGLVFHRGVPMTPEQIEIIYEQEPEERGIDMLDDETIGVVEKAFSYIRNRQELTGDDVFLPFRELVKNFNLSHFEEFALMMSAACEESPTYGRMLGFLVQNKSGHTATYGALIVMYEAIYGEDAEESYDSDKMNAFFFRPDENGSVPEMIYFRTLRLYSTMRDYIFGDGEISRDSNAFKERSVSPVFFDDEEKRIASMSVETAAPMQVYIEARDGEDVLHLLSCAAGKRNVPMYLLDEADSEEEEKVREEFIQKLIIAKLYPGFVVIRIGSDRTDDFKNVGEAGTLRRDEHRKKILRLMRIVRKYLPEGVVFLFGAEKMPENMIPDQYAPLVFPLAVPNRKVRYDIWNFFLKETGLTAGEDLDLYDMADRYSFSYGMIRTVVRRAALQTLSGKERVLTRDVLLPVIFRRNESDFGELATFIPAAYTWDDIEMDDKERKILMTACNRFRLRSRIDEVYGIADRNAYGNGVSVLMYGPPGTGKTMAARVISSELSLPLYRVDVSQIFSKYIGETEKNLGRIFKEAQKSDCILFFDEADSLFAKRTDVSDSHDRHANAQTAFLLQKIEEYPGMTLLATNLYHNFDNAFVRRITYVARFDAPDAATRERLWKNTLPDSVPMEDGIDFGFFAQKFELSGANIKAILMSAGYMAGAEGVPVSAAHIIRAMRYEFVKIGRIIDPPEFGKYVMYLYD